MFWPYAFETEIERFELGKYFYHAAFLPPQLQAELPFGKTNRLRVIAEVNGIPLQAALSPINGRHYLLLSKGLMKKSGFAVGDTVKVEFELDDPNRVHVPRELEDALEDDKELREAWEELTPGKRRGCVYQISNAKTSATREKRVEKLILELLG